MEKTVLTEPGSPLIPHDHYRVVCYNDYNIIV